MPVTITLAVEITDEMVDGGAKAIWEDVDPLKGVHWPKEDGLSKPLKDSCRRIARLVLEGALK